MATREEVINNLRACEKGNCNECTYSQCRMCEAQNSSGYCYDKLMLDAASLLQCDEVNDICSEEEGPGAEHVPENDISVYFDNEKTTLVFLDNEKAIRAAIKRSLNKEYYPGTKQNIDFIKKVLDYAQGAGIKYDVTDMFNDILTFATKSANHSDYCVKLVSQMKFKSEEDDQKECPANCPPEIPAMACEERRICKQDGHFYAEIIPLADRIDYICSFITDSSMKYKKPVRLSLVDELYELVKYYDRFAISEEDNRDWGSYSDHTF